LSDEFTDMLYTIEKKRYKHHFTWWIINPDEDPYEPKTHSCITTIIEISKDTNN